MFHLFTEKAIKVVMLAQEETRRLEHRVLGTEMILLGLLGEGEGVACKALWSMELNLKDARVEVEKIIGFGPGLGPGKPGVFREMPFSDRCKDLLEFAHVEAHALGHDYIGTEHLLLGLIREIEQSETPGAAAKVLTTKNIDLTVLRAKISDLLVEEGKRRETAEETTTGLPNANLTALFKEVAYLLKIRKRAKK